MLGSRLGGDVQGRKQIKKFNFLSRGRFSMRLQRGGA
ncbi:hypothetical protein SPHINGOT1_270183 [Sphingomonas sp. T1]|nr:hypothetical protein SPHINGOT1_270183 [Sphingomonas sp. T1]